MVEPKEVLVVPGGNPVAVDVRIFNVSSIVDAYAVEAPQAPAWLHVDPGEVRLLPNTDEVVRLTISIPGQTLVPAHQAGLYVQVRSFSDPAVRYGEHVQMTVPAIDAPMTLRLEPSLIRLRDTGTGHLQLTADNRSGNDRVLLHLAGRDLERVVHFSFSPPVLDVPLGQVATADVQIDAPRPDGGQEATRQLSVAASSDDGRAIEASATLVQTTSDRRPMVRLLLILLGGLAMVLGAYLPWTRPSPINAVDRGVDWTYLIYGDEIMVRFLVLRADIDALVPNILTSAGFVAIVLGALAILGVTGKNGWLTRVSAVLLALFLTVFLVVLWQTASAGRPAAGAIVIYLGCVAAFVGSLFTRR